MATNMQHTNATTATQVTSRREWVKWGGGIASATILTILLVLAHTGNVPPSAIQAKHQFKQPNQLNDLPARVRDYVRSTWPSLLPEPTNTNPALGIELPSGVQANQLPAGLSDYLRDHTDVSAPAAVAAPIVPKRNPIIGIDAPYGVDQALLPSGYRDYFRINIQPSSTNPTLGIDLPRGATLVDLPAGLTDYLRNDEVDVSKRTNPELGIDPLSGVTMNELPIGYSDYFRSR